MTAIAFFLVFMAHLSTGLGLVHLFRLKLHPVITVALSTITGIVVASLIPMLLEIAHIPITGTSVFGLLAFFSVLFPALAWKGVLSFVRNGLGLSSPRLYEYPFLLLWGILLISSIWRAFYFPPNARDILSGPEPIAEYAIREHSLINSVLTVNLETTNNHHKPAFISGLQIIYKLAGFPFGQVWLSLMFVSFSLLLYRIMREKLHPILAHLLLVIFTAIPEMYSYTFIILFDYPNMVLFTSACYLLTRYFITRDHPCFNYAVLLLGLATWVRAETLLFIAALAPLVWASGIRHKIGIGRIVLQTVAMALVPLCFYAIWVNVFLKHYMPAGFVLDNNLNHHLADLSPIAERFKGMHSEILIGGIAVPLWSYYLYITVGAFAAELLFKRTLTREGRNYLYAALVIYLGLPIVGYLLPLADLMHTTKRGLFKMMPLLLLMMANNQLLLSLSARINEWELNTIPSPSPAVASLAPGTKPKKQAGKRKIERR